MRFELRAASVMNNFNFSAAEFVLIGSQARSVHPACKHGLRERAATCNDLCASVSPARTS